MKAVSLRSIISAVFLIAAALLTSCSDSVSSQPGAADQPAGSASPVPGNNAGGSSTSSGYPKLASAVATAQIKGLDGSTYTLNDKTGKILLVNLWATWCGPCRFEIPALVRMQEKHGPQGFEVLGLNTDDEELQLINDFAAELKVNYPIAYADTGLQASMLKISKFPGIPQSFLIDRDGRLRGVFKGANPADIRKMEEVVAKVVNETEQAPQGEPELPAQPVETPSPTEPESPQKPAENLKPKSK